MGPTRSGEDEQQDPEQQSHLAGDVGRGRGHAEGGRALNHASDADPAVGQDGSGRSGERVPSDRM